MTFPPVKLSRGIHVMHLFYALDRSRWSLLPPDASAQCRSSLESLLARNAAASHPRLNSFACVGAKADLAFILYAGELGEIAQMHRDLENCFPPGTLVRAYSYFSVTELSEYMPTEEDNERILLQEGLTPGAEAYESRSAELKKRRTDYEHYRLYPEIPDWEIMGFYPMRKRRDQSDNWYMLDFAQRKRLMAGHARVGRKYAGRVSQLITGSTGLDDYEWGVTLMAHQTDALKEIVYEMRFDEVTARYGEFGTFYIALRLSAVGIWEHFGL